MVAFDGDARRVDHGSDAVSCIVGEAGDLCQGVGGLGGLGNGVELLLAAVAQRVGAGGGCE